MLGFFVRLVISALGLWLAQAIVPGIEITGTGTLVAAALLLGIVNALVRPLVILLTLPLTLVTLGLFLFVVNAAMFGLVAALLGSIVVGLTGWVASWYVGPRGRVEVLVVRS